jgi:hypothetical protein
MLRLNWLPYSGVQAVKEAAEPLVTQLQISQLRTAPKKEPTHQQHLHATKIITARYFRKTQRLELVGGQEYELSSD